MSVSPAARRSGWKFCRWRSSSRKLAILDETDSGLDIDALKLVAEGVNALRAPDRAMLVITHYQRLLAHIVPDRVHVLANGRIVQIGRRRNWRWSWKRAATSASWRMHDGARDQTGARAGPVPGGLRRARGGSPGRRSRVARQASRRGDGCVRVHRRADAKGRGVEIHRSLHVPRRDARTRGSHSRAGKAGGRVCRHPAARNWCSLAAFSRPSMASETGIEPSI